MEKKIRSVILARVSTADQITIPQQVEAIKKQMDAKGELLVGVIEEKESVSNKDENDIDLIGYINRINGLRSLIEKAKKKDYDKVWCWKWDRFARDAYFQEGTCRMLSGLGIKCESLMEGDHPFMRRLAGAYSQMEITQLRDRIRLGALTLIKQGIPPNNVPFGYKRKGKRNKSKVTKDEKNASVVISIFNNYLEIQNISKVATRLSLTKAKVQRAIKNYMFYAGKIKFDGIYYQGKYEPLINEDLAKKCFEIYQKSRPLSVIVKERTKDTNTQ